MHSIMKFCLLSTPRSANVNQTDEFHFLWAHHMEQFARYDNSPLVNMLKQTFYATLCGTVSVHETPSGAIGAFVFFWLTYLLNFNVCSLEVEGI